MTGTSQKLNERAIGRWRYILPALGMGEVFLNGKAGPCPICGGGKDRFVFDDRGGRGTFICRKCGAGSGVDLVMKFAKVQFAEAARMIEKHLPDAPIIMPKARAGGNADRHVAKWMGGQELDGRDPASLYLFNRCIEFSRAWSGPLRVMHRAIYVHEDERREEATAMGALIVNNEGERSMHYTFIDPRHGTKALHLPKQRKLAPGKFPTGGAIRLSPAEETMGVAEGIETALSASLLFGMPVWATTSAGQLARWKPPPEARHVFVFGDCDHGYAGQYAAFGLAQALSVAGYRVDVELPPMGMDWNDVLVQRAKKSGVKQ